MPRRREDDDYPDDPGRDQPDQPGDPQATPDPGTTSLHDAIAGLYRTFLGRDASEAEIQSHMGNPGGLAGIQRTIAESSEAQEYNQRRLAEHPTTPTPNPNPPPPNPGIGTFPTFTERFTAPPTVGDLTFTPPKYTPPPAFAAPSYTDATADPGYKFARDQGLGAISNSRAAQGLWGTGATGKALESFATDLANTHYGDVFQRALGTYLTNYDSQFKQPYDYAYKGAYDTFQGNQRLNEVNYDRAYTRYLDDYNRFRNERNDRWDQTKPFIFD